MSIQRSNIGREAVDASLAVIKENILGTEPTEPKARIGFMMARMYFSLAIKDAEEALQNPLKDIPGLEQMLKLAFGYSSSGYLRDFDKETLDVIERCTVNFRARYEPLLQRLELAAASP